jgi:hypothetical protein
VLTQFYELIENNLIKPIVGELNKYSVLKRRVSEFYVVAKLSSLVKIIKIESIVKRVIIIDQDGDNVMLTPVVELNEHD